MESTFLLFLVRIVGHLQECPVVASGIVTLLPATCSLAYLFKDMARSSRPIAIGLKYGEALLAPMKRNTAHGHLLIRRDVTSFHCLLSFYSMSFSVQPAIVVAAGLFFVDTDASSLLRTRAH